MRCLKCNAIDQSIYQSNYSPSFTLAPSVCHKTTGHSHRRRPPAHAFHLACRKTQDCTTHKPADQATHQHRLHHCIYAADSGTGTAAAPVSVLTFRSIAVVFIHPLSLLHLRRPPAQVPADCLHASRVLVCYLRYSLASRVPRSAGRLSLGSPETFQNSTWT
jgi:hypothetical protein